MSITAIIPAAGQHKNILMIDTNLPNAMIPINGKPIIGHIINDLFSRKIYNLIIILNSTDNYTEKYIKKIYKHQGDIKIIYNTDYNRGLGYSLFLGVKKIKNHSSVLVYLGDTIYKGKLFFDNDFLIVDDKYEETKKWCFVEKIGDKIKYIDKPKEYTGRGKVLCGIYYFKNGKDFSEIAKNIEKKNSKFEMKNYLEMYNKKNTFKLIKAKNWYDCGNLENYYKAKIDFLRVRGFNSIKYNDLFGTITKSSTKNHSINREINWYLNAPEELKIFAPRMVDYKIADKKSEYSLEFYGYQSLADLFIFESLHINVWQSIIKRIFEIINIFKKYKTNLPYSFYYEMYYQKTINRLNQLQKIKYWDELLKKEKISINGKIYKNISHFLPKIESKIKQLYSKKEMSFIHGDSCLANILFDPHSRIFKLLDPRGCFGKTSVYGDIKYDIAKLRHSFHGLYEFIISDLFIVKKNKNNFLFEIYHDKYNIKIQKIFDSELIKNGFDLNQIKFIEALLFLSMTPLHNDFPKRQKAMYLIGIKLINELNI